MSTLVFLSAVVRQDLTQHPSLAYRSFLPSVRTMLEATAWLQLPLPGWRTNSASTCPNLSLPVWFQYITQSQPLPLQLKPHRGPHPCITLPSPLSSTRSQTLR